MKYLTGLLFLLLCFNGAYSQVVKKNFVLGGRCKINSEKSESGANLQFKENEYSVEFSTQYFISNRITVGIGADFENRNYESNIFDFSEKGFTVGPETRYYLVIKKFALSPQLSLMFGRNTYSYIRPTEVVDKAKYLKFQGCLGLIYFVSESIGIEMLLSRKFQQYNNSVRPNTYSNNVNFGIMFYFK